MKKLLCAVALLSALCLSQARATDKLKVTIYYETLCPACMNFILTGLYPAYSELGSYLDLEMVPYQWCRESEGEWTCMCQHGNDECLGNTYASCAFANYTTKVALEFIHCVEQEVAPDEPMPLKQCAKQANISYEDLKQCAETEGLEMLIAAFKKAQDFKLPYLPFTSFNDKFDRSASIEAFKDFRKAVCRRLSNRPKECSTE
ncbi:unnamed protein product [Acanthoscelides obtectus]|uniref:Uncharacterized protein n=1 Tax=Acanthoscelides obtectus TaxID=200917 RepID=A0A9P0PQI8_ACAOB|nr:unnamed protein product [Acanthoscelides obtectus]CAK1672464.1 GILT-like protein 1 [Acanthoscelides obtectus]